MSNTYYTFWKLLDAYKIEIPMIQRDYAQGRDDRRAEQVRNAFLDALSDAITAPRKINLEFIYGEVERKKLVLLDGQQRVTTLFLLHWYLAMRAGSLDDGIREMLLKFSYSTRISSRAFCHALVKAKPFGGEDIPSKSINSAPWFFRSWRQDPTIRAMLKMLDGIAERQWGNYADAWTRLTDSAKAPIGFHFLETKTTGQTDDLYLKMNARGKALTDYENFKAWLQAYVESEEVPVRGDWTEKLDTDWMDIFWRFRPTPTGSDDDAETDDAFLRFFRGMGLSHTLVRDGSQSRAELSLGSPPVQEADITRFNTPAEYIELTFYAKHQMFDKDSLEGIFRVLDALEGDGHDQIGECLKSVIFFGEDVERYRSLFVSFVSPQTTFSTRAAFYGFTRFLAHLRPGGAFDASAYGCALRDWMRVVRNLISNAAINASTFARVIQAICDLAATGSQDIYGYLARDGAAAAGRWPEQLRMQLGEEITKARLIFNERAAYNHHPKEEKLGWEESLHKAENHSYFRGRIGFLLDFARNQNGYDLKEFKRYATEAMAIFQEPDSPCMSAPSFLLHRALLTKCDDEGVALMWASNSAENYSLGENRAEWTTKLLHNDEAPAKAPWVQPLLKNLKVVLDDIEIDREKEGLEKIVEASPLQPDDWRGCFIRAPKVIYYCTHRKFKFAAEERLFPFSTSTMSGYHSELRSHAFYCNYLEPLREDLKHLGKAEYWYRPGHEDRENNWPCTVLKGEIYKVKLLYGTPGNKCYTLQFYPVNAGVPSAAWESVLTASLGFSINGQSRGYVIYLGPSDESVLGKLVELANTVAEHCPNNV